jgi:uncharacterized protein (TIGR00725 family)
MAIIGVMGSGQHEWAELAEPLGEWIARNGHDLLTGAGRGVMTAVARGFCSVPRRRGRSIGVVPTQPDVTRGYVAQPHYPNPYIDLPILAPLPRKDPDMPLGHLTRNHINILTSDVVIALPGGQGTQNEIDLCLQFHRPLMCFGRTEDLGVLPPEVSCSPLLDDIVLFLTRHCISG